VATTSEEEKKNCCVDGPIIALFIVDVSFHCFTLLISAYMARFLQEYENKNIIHLKVAI
jgi:hypothetical protein